MGAVAALLAVGAATWVVLRDVMAYDRPPPAPKPERPPRQPRTRAEPTTVVLGELVEEDDDERRRRAGAALVLLALTLVTAALVGAGVYQLVLKFG